ncbi:slyX protein [Salipiger pallidus]|uniref:SlyX protein n=1 Tax=Salipiger pallidus TaxID=1775170 RepID=A0A8J2ZN86_9RHOB|nr:SlyX family protein [Salipiger pallidus]GGG82873.1 slyX protein [Salipiger pallidus]
MTQGTTDAQALEERIAYLERAMDDLSDTIARQDGEIALLTRRVALLLEREAERQSDGGGSAIMADVRPPHY